MVIPNLNLLSPAEHEFEWPLEWKIKISAVNGGEKSPPVILGTSREAKQEYDQLDLLLPPGINGDVRVAFRRTAEFGIEGDFLSDIRPPLVESQPWSFSVLPAKTRGVELNFELPGEALNDYDFILTDLQGRTAQNLRLETVYRFIASTERHFTLTVKSKAPGNPFLLPKSYELHQNLPNPFNPQTLIKYDLPEAAQVRLEIFNLLGQRVATLVNAFQPAGPKSVLWEGTDQRGIKVSSGLYIYKIRAGSFSVAKKMLLLK
jgi:hypothetical protein